MEPRTVRPFLVFGNHNEQLFLIFFESHNQLQYLKEADHQKWRKLWHERDLQLHEAHISCFTFSIFESRLFYYLSNQCLEQIDVIIGLFSLKHHSKTFKSHSSIDMRCW